MKVSRYLSIFCIVLCIFLLIHPQNAAIASMVATDCDKNGVIDSADILALNQQLVETTPSPTQCDPNQDGKTNSADLLCLTRLVEDSTAQCAPANASSPLATNLSSPVDYSSEYILINASQVARQWITRLNWSVWGTNRPELLDLDENGYVRTLPDPNDPNPPYRWVATFLFKDIGDNYPAGEYLVLYDGTGELYYGGDAKKNVAKSQKGRDVIDVTPRAGIELMILSTDPNHTGDYIRNIRVMHPGFHNADLNREIFHPDFLESIKQYKILRFMDWLRTNYSYDTTRDGLGLDSADTVERFVQGSLTNYSNVNTPPNWADRAKVDDFTFNTDKGMPIELMTRVGNQLNADIWLNIPHHADDEYVRSFADLVFQKLEPTQKVYLEYSNEVWNDTFAQGNWVKQQGVSKWPNANSHQARLNWYGMRSSQICEIWKEAWGNERNRIVCVVGVQAYAEDKSGVVEQVMKCPLAGGDPTVHCGDNIDAIAIAPYFGNKLIENHSEWVSKWINGSDGGLDELFQQLEYGGVVPGRTSELEISADAMRLYKQTANQYGVDLIAYEGGQHLVNYLSTRKADDKVDAFLATANNDPRMKSVYARYLKNWHDAGGKWLTHFNNTQIYGYWGYWGAQEHYGDTASPKLEALNEYMAENKCSWANCDTVSYPRTANLIIQPISSSQLGAKDITLTLANNGNAIYSVGFELNYDTNQLRFNGTTRGTNGVRWLTANGTVTMLSEQNGVIKGTIYNSAEPLSGDLVTLSFDQFMVGGMGISFVQDNIDFNGASCGNDFGQALPCQTSAGTLNNAPTATNLRQTSAMEKLPSLLSLLGLTLVTLGMIWKKKITAMQ